MIRRLLLVPATALGVAGCGHDQTIDPMQQVGPNPVLPAPSEELIAAVGVPKVIGWKPGETPQVPPGFKIEAMATGLSNPRTVWPLAVPGGTARPASNGPRIDVGARMRGMWR